MDFLTWSHMSLPGLTRQSIRKGDPRCTSAWMPGSSPGMTKD
jgi:hypothetical protein